MPHLPVPTNWVDLDTRFPEPHEAMVLKIDGDDWLGVVIGLYHGREITAFVMSSPERVIVAPMVPNGVEQEHLVTHFRAWPQADVPVPRDTSEAVLGAVAHPNSHQKAGSARQ